MEAEVREKRERRRGNKRSFYEKATGGRNLPGERTRGRQETKKRTLRKRIWRKRRQRGGPEREERSIEKEV